LTKEDSKLLKRRTQENHLFEALGKNLKLQRLPLKKQKKFRKKIRISRADYTFLQYHGLVFRYVMKTFKISMNDLSLLLYLHPLVLFTSTQFYKCQRQLSFNDNRAMGRLKRGGFVALYQKVKTVKHYTLTHRANKMITNMYEQFLSERPISMDPRYNAIMNGEEKRDQKMIELLEEFNRKVREKVEKKAH